MIDITCMTTLKYKFYLWRDDKTRISKRQRIILFMMLKATEITMMISLRKFVKMCSCAKTTIVYKENSLCL